MRGELGALRNAQLWIAVAAGSIGFGGMFAVYSYIAPLVTEVTGLPEATVPVVLALFGIGMTVGTVVGGRMADRSVLRVGGRRLRRHGALSLVLVALTGGTPVPAIASVVLLGVTSQVLGLALQTRLMDLVARRAVARCGAVPLGAQRGQRRRGVPRRRRDRRRVGLPGAGLGRDRAHARRAWRSC